MTTIDLSASLGIAATPEKFGTTSKETKKASHPSKILSFKMVKLVQEGWFDETVRKVIKSLKSSPEVAVWRVESVLGCSIIIILLL